MDERLVVSVLVRRTELQVAVEEELEAGAVARDDDALIRSRARVDDVVGEHAILGERGQAGGLYESGGEKGHQYARLSAQARHVASDDGPHQPRRPKPDGGVEETEEETRADESEFGDEKNGKEERRDERAD